MDNNSFHEETAKMLEHWAKSEEDPAQRVIDTIGHVHDPLFASIDSERSAILSLQIQHEAVVIAAQVFKHFYRRLRRVVESSKHEIDTIDSPRISQVKDNFEKIAARRYQLFETEEAGDEVKEISSKEFLGIFSGPGFRIKIYACFERNPCRILNLRGKPEIRIFRHQFVDDLGTGTPSVVETESSWWPDGSRRRSEYLNPLH